jgi:hypothetical protein
MSGTGSLGIFKPNEALPIRVRLPMAPTGTPNFRITKPDGTQVWPASGTIDLVVEAGTDNKIWRHLSTVVPVAAVAGKYIIVFSAVIGSSTEFTADTYQVNLASLDDIKSVVDAIGIGTGTRDIFVRIQNGSAENQVGAKVSIFDSGNTALQLVGPTGADGRARFNLDDGTYYVRVGHSGFAFTPQTITVTQDETFTLFGTSMAYSSPSDPALCRVFVTPIDLSGNELGQTEVTITAYSHENFTKTAGGHFIADKELTFTFNSSTDPDSWYMDLLQGATVNLACDAISRINGEIVVPAQANVDLDLLM